MTKWKQTKRRTTVHKSLQGNLNIEQLESNWKPGWTRVLRKRKTLSNVCTCLLPHQSIYRNMDVQYVLTCSECTQLGILTGGMGWMYAIIGSHFVSLEGKFLLIALYIVRITLNVIVRQIPLRVRKTTVCPSFKNLLSNSKTLRQRFRNRWK
jgi:hypothetical protein